MGTRNMGRGTGWHCPVSHHPGKWQVTAELMRSQEGIYQEALTSEWQAYLRTGDWPPSKRESKASCKARK